MNRIFESAVGLTHEIGLSAVAEHIWRGANSTFKDCEMYGSGTLIKLGYGHLVIDGMNVTQASTVIQLEEGAAVSLNNVKYDATPKRRRKT
jgi:hypothetical protein